MTDEKGRIEPIMTAFHCSRDLAVRILKSNGFTANLRMIVESKTAEEKQ